ncbi:MAG: hypothetical protein JWP30_878 [Homoserinimonas sp.]|nr:hypothetical protein [Homoserinimonas sp.]
MSESARTRIAVEHRQRPFLAIWPTSHRPKFSPVHVADGSQVMHLPRGSRA